MIKLRRVSAFLIIFTLICCIMPFARVNAVTIQKSTPKFSVTESSVKNIMKNRYVTWNSQTFRLLENEISNIKIGKIKSLSKTQKQVKITFDVDRKVAAVKVSSTVVFNVSGSKWKCKSVVNNLSIKKFKLAGTYKGTEWMSGESRTVVIVVNDSDVKEDGMFGATVTWSANADYPTGSTATMEYACGVDSVGKWNAVRVNFISGNQDEYKNTSGNSTSYLDLSHYGYTNDGNLTIVKQ